MKSEEKEKISYFIIIVFPNMLFFIVLGFLIALFFLYDLQWIVFPGQDVFYPLRLIELILGTLMLIIGLHIFSWGVTTISTERASGIEIGKSPGDSTLINYGAFSFCRHPITLGFLLIMPGIGLIFDFIPMLLMTPIYSPMLIGLLFYEERELLQRYGEKYKEYKKEVPFLIPRIRRAKK
jgi:protein-S-isoprenylcysteine O-methyltransferase Ste14